MLNALEVDLRMESAVNSDVHDHKMMEIQRIRAELDVPQLPTCDYTLESSCRHTWMVQYWLPCGLCSCVCLSPECLASLGL